MTTANIKDDKKRGVNWKGGEQFLRKRGIGTLFTKMSPDFDAPLPEDFLLKPLRKRSGLCGSEAAA